MDQMSANRKHHFVLSFDATQNYTCRFVKLHHNVEICEMDMVNFFPKIFVNSVREKNIYVIQRLLCTFLKGLPNFWQLRIADRNKIRLTHVDSCHIKVNISR